MKYRRKRNGPASADLTFLFAHGSGAAMDTPFMDTIAKGVGSKGVRVVRFEFPYMRQRREGGSRRPPDRQPVLLESWREEIRATGKDPAQIVIGGKSMGGRMASLIADEFEVAGCICLGYPFHPPGKPDQLRTEHLEHMVTPTLILQGERDTFGTPEEVDGYTLSRAIDVRWLPDGDHSFKPRKRSGHTEEANLDLAVDQICQFLSL